VDVIIVTALEEERDAVLHVLGRCKKYTDAGRDVYLARVEAVRV
jgi:hypothetical protein